MSETAKLGSDLSSKKMEIIKKTFSLYEFKSSGKLKRDNLPTAIRCLGINPSESELESLLLNELSGISTLDFTDFLGIVIPRLENVDIDEELREGFMLFDREGSGKISAKELRFVFSNLGAKLKAGDIDTLFREYDIGNADLIDYPKFCQLFKL